MNRRVRVIGLTGGIATGKSTVLKMLSELYHVDTLSADQIVHKALAPRQAVYRAVVKAFGRTILTADHQIDRRRLGRLVFKDSQARRRLERIVHPHVIRFIKAFIRRQKGLIVVDIPLLFEADLTGLVDFIVVVSASPTVQLRRLNRRNALSATEARRRLAAQWPLSKKRRLADVVISNDGSLRELKQTVQRRLGPLLVKDL